MKIINNIADWKEIRRRQKQDKIPLGFVPTMGALHQGHAALMKKSLQENQETIVSIFVNPTQFNNPHDLQTYPQSLEADKSLIESLGVQWLFLPTYEMLYKDQYKYRVSENSLSQILCGSSRPGHFDGVLTVVMKLFNIVEPDRAYFGEKDHQQLQLVRGMVDAFFLPIEIVAVPTVREEDGLAMSSRNLRLNSEDRKRAAQFYAALKSGKTPEEVRDKLETLGFQVDYIQDIDQRRYGAVFLNDVRLIDNVTL